MGCCPQESGHSTTAESLCCREVWAPGRHHPQSFIMLDPVRVSGAKTRQILGHVRLCPKKGSQVERDPELSKAQQWPMPQIDERKYSSIIQHTPMEHCKLVNGCWTKDLSNSGVVGVLGFVCADEQPWTGWGCRNSAVHYKNPRGS